MPNVRTYSISFRRLGTVVGLAAALLAGLVSETGRPHAHPIAPPLLSGSVGNAPIITLDYHPQASAELYHEVRRHAFFQRLGRGARKVLRFPVKVVKVVVNVGVEVAEGTIEGTGEALGAVKQVAQVPARVGGRVGSEVGGWVGGMLGGEKGRRAGRRLGKLAGEIHGGRVAGRSSLMRANGRAGARIEHIQSRAAEHHDKLIEFRRILHGDLREVIGEIPGVIQENPAGGAVSDLLDRTQPRVPTSIPRPPTRAPTPVPIPHPH